MKWHLEEKSGEIKRDGRTKRTISQMSQAFEWSPLDTANYWSCSIVERESGALDSDVLFVTHLFKPSATNLF